MRIECPSEHSVVDRNISLERFVKRNAGPGEAEAMWMGLDLKAAPFPLHNVIVADQAFGMKTADPMELGGGGTPGFFRFARGSAEAPVVGRQKAARDPVRGGEISSASDVGDVELGKCASELRVLAAVSSSSTDQ